MSNMKKQSGFTLVELMISLVLGLLVVAAAGGIFLSNRRVYASTEGINRIQENQRVAFELLARDLREAGASPCGGFASKPPVIQVENSPNAGTWNVFSNGLSGTDSGTATAPDTLTLFMTDSSGNYQVKSHTTPSAELDVVSVAGLVDGEELLVCNSDVSVIFKVTGLSSGTQAKIQHGNTGNCGQEFQWEMPANMKCNGASNDNGYCFYVAPGASKSTQCSKWGETPASVVRPYVVVWSVANNGRGGTSLYRTRGGVASEVAEGVTNLQFQYRRKGASADYVDAGSVADWRTVTAVRAVLTVQATSGATSAREMQGTDNQALSRVYGQVMVVRNHLDVM